ncbi:hypothetical protein ACEPAH_3901 [Sanghuangporus vaninii]
MQVASAEDTQVVDLGYAKYQGVLNATLNITSFLGMRYASPPLGELRFQVPQPPTPVSEVQMADTMPQRCPQAASGQATDNPFTSHVSSRETYEIEDCLFINVFVPSRIKAASKLPVVVFIHGGGYVAGGMTQTHGSDLIREGQGHVIAVEMQYRIGLFGFLAGSQVKDKGALNAGLLDQELALKWIQKYISSFGGDPSKVTIWGQSAGAGSVYQHIVAHGGETEPPLFRAGMTSSTFVPPQYNYNDPVPESVFQDVLKQTGPSCSNSSSFECLVSLDASVLQEVNVLVCNSTFHGTMAFTPVIDGELITERPIDTIRKGRLNGQTLLSVTNSFEGKSFVDRDITAHMTLSQYVKQLFPTLTDTQIATAVKLYVIIDLVDVNEQAAQVYEEAILFCPTYFLLDAFPHGMAFKGEFAVPPALHASDVGYYFPSSSIPPIPNPILAAAFSRSFLSMVQTESPRSDGLQDNVLKHWPAYDDRQSEMLFNITGNGTAVVKVIHTDSGLVERCR